MIEIKHQETGRTIHQVDATTLRQADLRGVDLSGADLSGAALINADLEGAELTGVDLTGACLQGASLREAGLHRTKLFRTDLKDADLRGANLIGAQLGGSILYNANLSGATLYDANVSGTDLRGATLVNADLSYAMLRASFLADTDLSYAMLYGTVFVECLSLCQAKGLDKIEHRGPSSLDRGTLQGNIEGLSDVFLTGVGYTEEEIEALRSLYSTAKPIQFYSCFISYSHADEEFAQRLHGRIRQAGLRVWYAPEEMKGGQKLHEQIDHAIQIHDRLLLVLSEDSLKSEWVATEIRKARKAERRENRQKLFPIRLIAFDPLIKEWECFDADSGKDLGVEVREYFIPDFTQWKKHDQFEVSFARLLQDMKAAEKTALTLEGQIQRKLEALFPPAEGQRWMETAQPQLDGSPRELMARGEAERVLRVLTRLEQGIPV